MEMLNMMSDRIQRNVTIDKLYRVNNVDRSECPQGDGTLTGTEAGTVYTSPWRTAYCISNRGNNSIRTGANTSIERRVHYLFTTFKKKL